MRVPPQLRAALLLVALVAAGCASANATTTAGPAKEASSVVEPLLINATATTTAPTTSTAPTTTTTTSTTTVAPTTTAAPTTTTVPPDPHETLIATARYKVHQLIALDEPNGDPVPLEFPVPNPHQFGGPLTLMITEGEIGDEWFKVQLPMRPNGREGWISVDDYIITSTTIRAEVDLSSTLVQVFDGDELIAESQAAVGTSRTPTPLGTFFVAAIRENPPAESYLGTHAVVLSGFSEALQTFSGGLPVIAIHGTNNPGRDLGHEVSNGCVRVPNDVVQFLAAHVPIGAPVIIEN